MKNSLVIFKRPFENIDSDILKKISNIFYFNNITFSQVFIVSSNDELEFAKIIERSKVKDDNLFIIKSDSVSFDFNNKISETLHTVFSQNENAKLIIENLNKKTNSNYPLNNAFIPLDAMLIANTDGIEQGYVLEDETFSLIVLPNDITVIKNMVNGYIAKYFEKKFNLKREIFTAKYFGEKDKLVYTLKEIENKYPFVNYSIESNYGDYLINLIFDSEVTKRDYDEVVRLFISRLIDGVYAEFDTSLSSRLFDLLKLREVKISTAESFTAGRIISSLIENVGASKYVYEGIVSYSSKSKSIRLNVEEKDLNTVGAVSSKVAYQMALDLLKNGDCDISISTTGYAGPDTDEFGNQVGLYYIGIGMKSGVDVYKYRASGSREEITETAKNTALFLAIKKLKKV